MNEIAEQLATQEYIEIFQRPKLEASIDRLIKKYYTIMTEYHITGFNELAAIIERAFNEHLEMMVLKEHDGYLILVWKGKNYY